MNFRDYWIPVTNAARHQRSNHPRHKHECAEDIHSFFDYRESLTIIDGIVMKDKRIVIPEGLCEQALENLHRSHVGIVKTKERVSTSMFWPKIYNDIENFLSQLSPLYNS